MKRKILLPALICLVFHVSFSQNKGYEKGYFINNKNNKIECLIKNQDWDSNPTRFTYKTDENTNPNVMSVNDIQEFSVGKEFKFRKEAVKYDESTDSYEENTSLTKALNLIDATLLLRVVIEGKASLYSFKNGKYTRFFYRVNNSQINFLSYKVYYQSGGYLKNETYKQELLNALKCDKITQEDINYLEYKTDKLSELFVKFNNCEFATIKDYREPKNIKTFEFLAKIGVSSSQLIYEDGRNLDFDRKTKFRPALEVELNLSTRAKNWSFLLEGGYQYYKSSYTYPNSGNQILADYKALDISLGLRKYFILTTKSHLFANVYYTYGALLPSKFKSTNSSSDLKLGTPLNPALGFGWLYDERYSVELRYEFSRNLHEDYLYLKSKYTSIDLNFAYKFF